MFHTCHLSGWLSVRMICAPGLPASWHRRLGFLLGTSAQRAPRQRQIRYHSLRPPVFRLNPVSTATALVTTVLQRLAASSRLVSRRGTPTYTARGYGCPVEKEGEPLLEAHRANERADDEH